METLKHKLIIKGQIKVITGLHIGGSSSSMEIGALDQNNVIKTANGIPYIPGSSLKGKLRNMLAKISGSESVDSPKEKMFEVDKIFGVGAKESKAYCEALLRVRDADLESESLKEMEMDFEYSEVKYENSINRITGEATPRPIERVPAGAIFNFEMIYDCFDESKEKEHLQALAFAMKMLQHDSLGGSGTRGSGKIEFKNIEVSLVKIDVEKVQITEATPEGLSVCSQFNDFKKDE
jgi:CRISPR-associated protein Csm3